MQIGGFLRAQSSDPASEYTVKLDELDELKPFDDLVTI